MKADSLIESVKGLHTLLEAVTEDEIDRMNLETRRTIWRYLNLAANRFDFDEEEE